MFRGTQFRKRCCTWRLLWAVHPWLWPVSLRMLCVVRQNEIRQRRKLVDRALCCVCSAINEYAHGRTTMGRRALPAIDYCGSPLAVRGKAWNSLRSSSEKHEYYLHFESSLVILHRNQVCSSYCTNNSVSTSRTVVWCCVGK